MRDQVGMKTVRVGAGGNEKDSNHANYEEAEADPYGDLPDALTLKSGQRVTSAEQWWDQRRPEIVEDFEREDVGRIPPNTPTVTSTVKSTTDSTGGALPIVQTGVVGHL